MIINTDKVIEIFCTTDDFCKQNETTMNQHLLSVPSPQSVNVPALSESEMITLLILYHHSGYKCFKYYYKETVLKELQSYFPKAPCYARFVALIPRTFLHLFVMVNTFVTGRKVHLYYADSKQLPVCHNRRIYSHKVFSGLAQRAKSSTGWFYGFKLFLVVNPMGEIIRALTVPANIADNNENMLEKLFKGFHGKVFADRGFITQKGFAKLFSAGLKLITGIRRNMKNKLMDMQEKLLLKKRGMIESIHDILMTICDIDHTRHRSPVNAFTHLYAGLAAYSFLERKPSILNKKFVK